MQYILKAKLSLKAKPSLFKHAQALPTALRPPSLDRVRPTAWEGGKRPGSRSPGARRGRPRLKDTRFCSQGQRASAGQVGPGLGDRRRTRGGGHRSRVPKGRKREVRSGGDTKREKRPRVCPIQRPEDEKGHLSRLGTVAFGPFPTSGLRGGSRPGARRRPPAPHGFLALPAPGPHLPGRLRRRGRAAGSAAAARGAARPRAHTGTAAPASFALAAPAGSTSRPRRAPGSPASRRRGRGPAKRKAEGRRPTHARPLWARLPSRPPPSRLPAVPGPAPQVPPTAGGGASAGQTPPPPLGLPRPRPPPPSHSPCPLPSRPLLSRTLPRPQANRELKSCSGPTRGAHRRGPEVRKPHFP